MSEFDYSILSMFNILGAYFEALPEHGCQEDNREPGTAPCLWVDVYVYIYILVVTMNPHHISFALQNALHKPLIPFY